MHYEFYTVFLINIVQSVCSVTYSEIITILIIQNNTGNQGNVHWRKNNSKLMCLFSKVKLRIFLWFHLQIAILSKCI